MSETLPQVVTYHSSNAPPSRAWIAHVVLPNGEYWGVRFEGYVEESTRNRAIACWIVERAKAKALEPHAEDEPIVGKSEPSEHHNAGKVWMINTATREKKRVSPDVAATMAAFGWERGGPRSK